MDIWRYYEVTHSTHDLLNPSCLRRIDELGAAIGLASGLRNSPAT